jgi:cephalosporin hydroxylase
VTSPPEHDAIRTFEKERESRLMANGTDAGLQSASRQWVERTMRSKYVYNFDWLGRPIIQYPQDIVAIQELVWNVRPDLIIETGIAHGGSLMLSASMLALLDLCDAAEAGTTLDPRRPRRKVLGVDIDIREHNRKAIEAHPLSGRIEMIQGPSTSDSVISQVRERASGFERVLVCLDSNHTHDHVLAELKAYAPLVSNGSYCVVFDTFVEDMPADLFPDRPWAPGNNPRTAVREFLRSHPEFSVDSAMEHKLLITVAPGGFLKRSA